LSVEIKREYFKSYDLSDVVNTKERISFLSLTPVLNQGDRVKNNNLNLSTELKSYSSDEQYYERNEYVLCSAYLRPSAIRNVVKKVVVTEGWKYVLDGSTCWMEVRAGWKYVLDGSTCWMEVRTRLHSCNVRM
jgi:hypothetical protein